MNLQPSISHAAFYHVKSGPKEGAVCATYVEGMLHAGAAE